MYTFSNRLRITSFILMIVGVLGIGYGFLSAPSTIEEAKAIVAAKEVHHTGGHEEAQATATHENNAAHDAHAEDHAAHDAHTLSKLQNRPWSAFLRSEEHTSELQSRE